MLKTFLFLSTLAVFGCGGALEPHGACDTAADCPVNSAASCAQACPDGRNPCIASCVDHACVEVACSTTDGGTTACAPTTEGQPNGDGQCCSEWVACATGLTCIGSGSTAPGSAGVCAATQNGACTTVADCPVNTAASCALVCADGTNPCVSACRDGQCAMRGCETNDAGIACTGPAPSCRGTDAQACCAQDPWGPATCVGSTWMCGDVVAPGCNGTHC